MMRAVSDASSLIHAAKVPALWELLQETFDEVMIPAAVHAETLKGEEIRSPDVPVIRNAISRGWVRVEQVESSDLPDNLGRGEREAISLMTNVKADWLLMDDRVASTTARLLGLPVRSLSNVIINTVALGRIGSQEGLVLLDELVESGYYLASKDYLEIRKLLMDVGEG
jgi:predicted nucleic acid-binding protein